MKSAQDVQRHRAETRGLEAASRSSLQCIVKLLKIHCLLLLPIYLLPVNCEEKCCPRQGCYICLADINDRNSKIENLNIPENSKTLIQGPSGSGKTTLLSLLAGILLPTSGQAVVLSEDLTRLNSKKRDAFRVDQIGFLFQQFNLIPYLNLIENVLLPVDSANYAIKMQGILSLV